MLHLNAEDPQTFVPSPGRVLDYHPPGGLRVRIDSALYSGYKVPSNYDSMVAKLIVLGRDRQECLRRLRRSLEEYVIDGIKTTKALHQALAKNPDVIAGNYDIHWLEKFLKNTKVEEAAIRPLDVPSTMLENKKGS